MKNIFTALLISLTFQSFSQNTFIKYTLCGDNTCNVKESHINTDGNPVVLRVYVKNPDNNAYLTEVDNNGNIIHNILISEPVANKIIFHSFIQTSDGGYLLTGNTHPGFPDGNACLLKITSDWQFEWAQAYKGDAPTPGEFGINVFETADKKYQFFQNSVNAIFISQLDNSGNVEWSKKIDSLYLHEVLPINENEVLINSSVETSIGFHEIRILKIDKEGNVVWSRKIQASNSYQGHVISQLSDNNFIFDALPDSIDNSNLVLLKIDPDGNLLWGKEYNESNGGVAINLMYFNEIPGSGIIQTAIEAFESGIYTMQLKIEGEVISANKILLKQHRVNYLTQMPDNGFIISGKRAVPGEKFSGFIIKTDALGMTACENENANFTYATNNNLVSKELIMKSFDAINSAGPIDLSVSAEIDSLDTYCIGSPTSIAAEITDGNSEYKITPNPFINNVSVSFSSEKEVDLKIYDLSGRLVMEYNNIKSNFSFGKNLLPGIYFLTIKDKAGKTYNLKIVKGYN